MNYELFEKLHQEGLVSTESLKKISEEKRRPLISLFWDLNTLLGFGVIAFTTGLGILIYKNIDTIGHQVILVLIAAISIACFTYCSKKKPPFTRFKSDAPTPIFDYVLLLGTLTMLTFAAYLQFQYEVFGTHYGLATFLPMVALFFIAYYFDHIGILNLAILNLGIWIGVTVTPRQLLLASTYHSETIIYTYLALGLFLALLALLTKYYDFKAHFSFSFQHLGVHVTLISLLASYIYHYSMATSFLWLFAMIILATLCYLQALKIKSFYFSLLALLYSYVAACGLIWRIVFSMESKGGPFELLLLFFIISTIGFAYLLKLTHQKIKAK